MQLFVILFKAEDGSEQEGIHTLSIGGKNTVLAFEAEDDATRFALMLEAQDFFSPTPEGIEAEEIKEFCEGAGLELVVVPEGELVVPPETSLEQTDWNPNAPEEAELQPDSDEQVSDESDEMEAFRRRLEKLL
ncbi:DUF3110 domain-containing protein [Leptolyngbya sp. FACHB-261]|uniref:DUF3110 domain-containing protein n=1 Tax=Leptolyngbya sp. FACHB-261 TaxID=2692806 RepID=UPI001682564D|nr:DUF3110 domain-containing protein [Leptolyngbya sp. FACHB-261]MBD2099697.1 DUF3110 domain-containing protein [Leptolyngbya sp. FACHB-261]